MFTKKRIIRTIVSLIVVSLILMIIPGIIDYFEYRSVVKATATMPWQDGGQITMVKEPCILDTPVSSPVTCAISCPLVTSVLGPACMGYIEIDTAGQLGTTFLAAPTGFVYQGGGTHPAAGMQFIAGGSTNAQPWVIGIPGKFAMRTQKVIDWFNKYIIAGLKD